MKTVSIIASVCLGMALGILLPPSTAHGQPKFRILFTMTDSGATLRSQSVFFGIHPDASNCIDGVVDRGFTDHWALTYRSGAYPDTAWEEEFPPGGFFLDLRFVSLKGSTCLGQGMYTNIRKYTNPTQLDTFQLKVTQDTAGHPLFYSWPSVLSQYCDSLTLYGTVPRYVGADVVYDTVRVNMLTQFSYKSYQTNFDNDDINQLKKFLVIMKGPKTPPLPPATVVLTSPAFGATGQEMNLTLTWNPVANARYYTLQFSKDSTFTDLTPSVMIFNDTLSTTSKNLSALKDNTWFYWRVVAWNEYGVSFWQSPPSRFQTKSILAAPLLVSPANNQLNVPVNATLLWRKVTSSKAVTYKVQVARDNAFSALVKDTSGVVDTTLSVDLQNCLTYYWRVKAANADGESPYSGTGNFSTVLAAPAPPVLVLPADAAVDVGLTPTLSWTGDVCATAFRLMVARDTGFTVLILNMVITQASRAIGPLDQDTLYYWKVKAISGLDSSQFPAYRAFRTLMNPAAAPLLLSPANADTTQPTAPAFRWSKSAYTTTYHLQVGHDLAFTPPLAVNDSSIVDTTAGISGLQHCTQYFWRVRAINRKGSAGFSQARTFRVVTVVPGAPVLVSPVNNQDSLRETVILQWQGGDACSYSYFYHLAVSSTFTDTVASGQTNQTSVTIGPIRGNTYYFWRVRAYNFMGIGVFSDSFRFHTTLSRPDTPRLLGPLNGVGDQPNILTLGWDSAAFAATYRVQLALDSGFTDLKLNDSTVQRQPGVRPSHQVGPLLNSTTYFWRVNAKNDLGVGGWSAVWRFTTLFPPAKPILNYPVNGATGVAITPTFDWSLADRGIAYRLQIAKDAVFSNPVFDDSTLTILSWAMRWPLESITKYYWRVASKNGSGWGPWSDVSNFTTTRSGVANWEIPLTIAETGPARDIVYFGVDQTATKGIDPFLGEYELPPVESGMFDARFVSPAIGEGLLVDVLPFTNYAQVDTYYVRFQPGIGEYPMKLSWPASFVRIACDSIVILDNFTTPTVRARMDRDSTLAVTNPLTNTLIIVKYGAFPVPTDVKLPPRKVLPSGYVLAQNYPNPFNPTTTVSFSTDRAARIRLTVYDVLGREIAPLADASFPPGEYSFVWNGKDLNGKQMPSGVYYLRMLAEGLSASAPGEDTHFTTTRKMLMVK